MDNELVENYKIQNISLKLRLYPNEEQKILLDKTFGNVRFVYNYYLNSKNNFYESNIKPLREEFGYFDLLDKAKNIEDIDKKKRTKEQKAKLKQLKIEIEAIRKETNREYVNYKEISIKELKEKYPWMKEASGQSVCNAWMNLQAAFKNFYEGRAELPKFHKKKGKNSFRDGQPSQKCLDWNSHLIQIPKIGKIVFRNRKAPDWYKNKIKICSMTCSRNPNGEYYVSVLFEVRTKIIQKMKSDNIDESQIIGLDFDCDDMYIDSNGKSAKLDFGFVKQKQKHSKRLAHLQRQLARKHSHSKSRERVRVRKASLEQHIANARKDWIEKESLRLVRSYKLIGLEDLNISTMKQGSKNAKNYDDISWSAFVGKLVWKSERTGCNVVKINRYFPSSQTCSCCGFKNKEAQIKHLEKWTCPECGSVHQRDENAAKNIAAESYKVLREAEESEEKSESLSKDLHSVLPVEELANLALCSA